LAKLGAEVIIRISVCPLTGGDSPNCVQLTPQLRQAAGTLAAMQRQAFSPIVEDKRQECGGQRRKKLKECVTK